MTGSLDVNASGASRNGIVRIYKILLSINLLLHLAIGLACLLIPDVVGYYAGLPGPIPDGWTRGWGATLILVTTLYLPGLRDPVEVRAPNIIGLFGRVWMGTVWVFCGGGFLWFAAFDYLWALILTIFYLRVIRST